jgi:hypothetical protein
MKQILFALSILMISSCMETGPSNETGQLVGSGVPTYSNWPSGTHAGSGPFVRNSSAPKPHQFARVSAPHPVRYGQQSERFELRDGDCSDTDCFAPRQRSEIIMGNNKSLNPRLDEDVWIGWSFYNASATTDPWLQPVVGQWKVNRDENGGYAIVSFKVPQSANLRSRTGNDNVFVELGDMQVKGGFTGNANSWGNACSLFNLDSVRGSWTDIVVNTNFGTSTDGYLNIWINGIQKCAYRGMIVASQVIDFQGADHRHGIYWSRTVEFDQRFPNQEKPTMVVYYDEYRVGPTRAQVDIRLIEAAGGPPVD